MKLKVRGTQPGANQQDKIILMAKVGPEGKPTKFIKEVACGSVFEVSDEVGAVLLGQYPGVVTVAGHEEKATEAPKNKMQSEEKTKAIL